MGAALDKGRAFVRYCERGLDPGFWAEPLNAVTNGAFLVAAVLAIVHLRRAGREDRPVFALALVVLCIAIGSFLFHTVPNTWTLLADVLPIQVFISAYFGLAMVRYLGCTPTAAGLYVIVFLLFSIGFGAGMARLGFGGGGPYLAALLALVVVGLLVRRRADRLSGAGRGKNAAWSGEPPVSRDGAPLRAVSRALLLAGGTFALSLTFRTIDLPVCARFPLGTHFLWHLLNATVLGILLLAALRHGPGTAQAATGR
jgi:hypothetical protein